MRLAIAAKLRTELGLGESQSRAKSLEPGGELRTVEDALVEQIFEPFPFGDILRCPDNLTRGALR